MSKSPGHRKWPEHKVEEQLLQQRLQVRVQGEVLADTDRAIVVNEDEYPPRYYVPRSDVAMEKLTDSPTTSQCPFKGHAHYYNINLAADQLEDAAWAYDEPYDEHRALAGHIAFYEEMPGIEINRLQ